MGPPERFGRARHVGKLFRAEQLVDAVGQIFDAVGFCRRAAFKEEIAVGGFLAGNRVKDEERASP